jgi:hypothetical protein
MTNEKKRSSGKGWVVVALHALLILAMVWIFMAGTNTVHWSSLQILAILFLLIIVAVILPPGYFTLQPNEAKVLVLFGKYKGTVVTDGFHWTNPLQLAVPRGKYTVSQRIRNFEIEKLKVNDKRGNPIEIANAMLRRQQAEAIIAARRKIVHGAVSMVEMALEDLKSKNVVDLDEERKAAMVSNLLVVLCGEAEAQPVINAGTLYK